MCHVLARTPAPALHRVPVNSCAMSALSLRVNGMHIKKGTHHGFRDPLLLRQHHMASVGIPGSGPWGGVHVCGRGKGGGSFALSSFKRTLFPLGLPLPCLTHKHRCNVYTHALCVDQYRKKVKSLDSKIEHVIFSHLSPAPHPNH